MPEERIELNATVPVELAGERLDAALAQLFPDFSRGRWQTWIKKGCVQVDAETITKNRYSLMGGETLVVHAVQESQGEWLAEEVPFDVVHEDEALLVINKPAGLVVHPGHGNAQGTLVNGLLSRYPELRQVPRAGIVHRLDKDTTGLLVVARHLQAHTHLVEQLQNRAFKRRYQAVVVGVPTAGGVIDAPIGRHPTLRTRMAVVEDGKPAVTHFRVTEKYRVHALLSIQLETGRTHQIRVHMAHRGFPLVGDAVYGRRPVLPKSPLPELLSVLQAFKRQALHACVLGLVHPESGEWQEWEAAMPDDMAKLCEVLKQDAQRG